MYNIRLCFVLLLLPFVSIGQDYLKFDLQNSVLIRLKDRICVGEKTCLYFTGDSSASYLKMYYIKDDRIINTVDSVDFSPYNSQLHIYGTHNNNIYVVLWKTEYEYFPVIIAYYVTEKNVVKMGELKVSLPGRSGESYDYPMKEIKISQIKDNIEISFVKNVGYRENDTLSWKEYVPGTLKYIFKIESKELKVLVF